MSRATRARRTPARWLLGLLLAGAWLAGLLYAVPADAHPLGNFSVNHLASVSVSSRQVDVRYLLDQAEIPTFQERGLSDAQVLARKRAEVARGLKLMVDGRPVALSLLAGGRLSHPAGQGGLPLTRVELSLRARLPSTPRAVVLRDETFPGRVGWRAIVARAGSGTDTRSDVPSLDPTRGLRAYPAATLTSPLDQRVARLEVRPGDGALAAARSPFAPAAGGRTSEDGFAGLLARAADGRDVLAFLLLAAFAWGALHALSPGHGKTMVAAYLVGTRGTARHAVALGAITTLTHTIGVFALAIVTLALSQYILPEQLYPWLTLASGVLVVGIGLGVLRSRARGARVHHHHDHDHDHDHGHRHHDHDHDHDHGHRHHDHDHDHDHGHHHDHDHGHRHHDHDHGHHRDHDHGHGHSHAPDDLSWRGLVAMGASAGLIPCPSALVVLLGAIAQHEIGLGLLLVTAFSLGLAATLTGLGLLVVYASRLTRRMDGPLSSSLAGALPALSAAIIVGAGILLTVRAVPGVLGT